MQGRLLGGSDRTLGLQHTMFVNEFGNTANRAGSGMSKPDFDTGESKFASLASSHLPLCFFRIESVCPARVIVSPPGGVMVTVNLVHTNAHSPNTLISWISLVPSN